MPRKVKYKGVTHQFPDDATDQEIQAALDGIDGRPSAGAIATLKKNIDSPQGGAGYQGRNPDDIKLNQETMVPQGDRGGIRGVGRAVMGLIKSPFDMAKASQTDDTQAEKQGRSAAGVIGPELLTMYDRMVNQPMNEQANKADEMFALSREHPELDEGGRGWVSGPKHMGVMHAIGSGVPVIGPIAANLTERALGGDPSGAAAEGLTYAAAPEVGEAVKGKVLKVAKKVAYPNAERMTKTPAGGEVNPVEAFTPLEIKEFAKDKGIPMTAAEITESGPLRALQSVGEKSLTGSGLIKDHKASAQGAVHKLTKQMASDAGPEAVTSEAGARAIREDVGKKQVASRKAADEAYANWRGGITDSVDVNLADVNKKYGNMADDLSTVLENVPPEQASKINQLLSKARDLGKHSADGTDATLGLDDVRELRSHWLEVQRDLARRGRKDSREAGLATSIAVDLDQAIEGALKHRGGDELVQQWRDANAGYKKHMETFYGDDSVLSKILETGDTDLAKLPGQILDKGTGGNPVHIRQLREAGVDLGPLQREVIDRVHNSGFNNARNALGGFEDDFLQQLFADKPEALNDLYKTAKIGRSVKLDSNPSNTGGTLSATGDMEALGAAAVHGVMGNPAAAAGLIAYVPGVKRLAASLTTSDWFNNWMTRVPEDAVGKLKKGPSKPPEDTSFDFGANKPEPPTPVSPPSGPDKLKKAEPEWPAEYKGGAKTLTKGGGGGANYTADQLAEFKKKHGIVDGPSAPKRELNLEEPDPVKTAVSKELDRIHGVKKLERRHKAN